LQPFIKWLQSNHHSLASVWSPKKTYLHVCQEDTQFQLPRLGHICDPTLSIKIKHICKNPGCHPITAAWQNTPVLWQVWHFSAADPEKQMLAQRGKVILLRQDDLPLLPVSSPRHCGF